MKRFYTLLLSLGMLLLLSVAASGTNRYPANIIVNGTTLPSGSAYIEDGTTMIPLRAVAEALGCSVEWDPVTRTVRITSPDTAQPPETTPLVVLDPGHGGSYQGAEYSGIKEKDLNLSIALQTAQLLKDNGINVLMTRSDDSDIDLYARTGLANTANATLFVSIHCNANTEHDDALGIYTCAYQKDSEGWLLAQLLQQSMCAAANAPAFDLEERPNLVVLRTSLMPAALVECGFMSTEAELALLVQPDYQARLAQGIADGILTYLAQ